MTASVLVEPKAPIRLVLADDHPIVLDGLARIFESEGDFIVAARAGNGNDALAAVHLHHPDVLVLDLRMPGKDGLSVLHALRAEGLSTRVVILTAAREGDVLEAVQMGVEGVVLKDMATALLVRAVREVHAGRRWIEKGTATHALAALLNRKSTENDIGKILTPREIEVARLTAEGHSNKVIAEKLSVTEGTAKLHLHHVYEKLGVDGRMALVRYLQVRGLG